MQRPIIDPPRVRPAGSLNLVEEDIAALRAFRAHNDAGDWYERQAQRVLRRATSVLAERGLGKRDRILLFERDGELQAVSAFAQESAQTALLGFVGIKHELHGALIDAEDGDRLSDAVLDSSLDVARDLGFTRVAAQVAYAHEISRAMLRRAGFKTVSGIDRDYQLCAVVLT